MCCKCCSDCKIALNLPFTVVIFSDSSTQIVATTLMNVILFFVRVLLWYGKTVNSSPNGSMVQSESQLYRASPHYLSRYGLLHFNAAVKLNKFLSRFDDVGLSFFKPVILMYTIKFFICSGTCLPICKMIMCVMLKNESMLVKIS